MPNYVGAINRCRKFDLCDDVFVVVKDFLGFEGVGMVTHNSESIFKIPILHSRVGRTHAGKQAICKTFTVSLGSITFQASKNCLDPFWLVAVRQLFLLDHGQITCTERCVKPDLEGIDRFLLLRQFRNLRGIKFRGSGELIKSGLAIPGEIGPGFDLLLVIIFVVQNRCLRKHQAPGIGEFL